MYITTLACVKVYIPYSTVHWGNKVNIVRYKQRSNLCDIAIFNSGIVTYVLLLSIHVILVRKHLETF
jgi:hypothetical protein